MIKRLAKSKKSKKGAILVIVVLILALAMIFIASAMMLTQATRRRLYSTTMQSQARLTVTAASEVFLEALNMQEISDTQLEAVMGKTHGSGKTKVKMCVPNVPGMSEAENNCTYIDVYKDPENASIVYCDFTTTIGDETENVQVVLKADSSEPSSAASFKNQIEVCGDVKIAELKFTSGVGMWNKSVIANPTDNTVVMRDGYVGQTGDSHVFSDVIFGNASSIKLGGGDVFHGNNLVFLQGAVMTGRSSMTIESPNIYFIGHSGNQPGMSLKNSDGFNIDLWGDGIKTTNFIFAGRTIENDSSITQDSGNKIGNIVNKSGNKCYFVDKAGNCLFVDTNDDGVKNNGENYVTSQDQYYKSGDSGKYTVDNAAYNSSTGKSVTPDPIKKSVARYWKYDYAKNSSSNPFPTAAKVFKEMSPNGYLTSTGVESFPYVTYGPKDPDTGVIPEYPADVAIPIGKKYNPYPVTSEYPAYKKNAANQPSNYLYIDKITSSKYLEPGYYYVTSGGGSTQDGCILGGGEAYRYNPIILTIDGSRGNEYRFYFEGGKNFLLRGIIFAIYNADSDKPVLFILESGANVQFSHNNDKLEKDGTVVNKLCTAGVISMPNRPGCSTKAEIENYIGSHAWASESKEWNSAFKGNGGTIIKYSEYYDSIHKPAAFIFGANNNVVTIGPNVTLESYIGLYGEHGGFGPITGAGGGGPCNTNVRQNIYGRVECAQFCTWDNQCGFTVKLDNTSGDLCMPYCPQPGSDNKLPDQRIAKSKYSVVDIIYYYEAETSASSS